MSFIKRVISIDAYHEQYVNDAIYELQEDGYEIISYERIKKMFLVFGEDITEIKYIKQSQ